MSTASHPAIAHKIADKYLVKLVTKIYWVDIVAFEVGEHDDLHHAHGVQWLQSSRGLARTHEKDHRKQQPSSHEHREKE